MNKRVTAETLRRVFHSLTKDQDLDWNDVIEGKHPDVKDLEARLDKTLKMSQAEDSISRSVVLTSLPGHSCLERKNERSAAPLANAKPSEETVSKKKRNLRREKEQNVPIRNASFKQTAKLQVLNLDDDSDGIVAPSNKDIDNCFHTAARSKGAIALSSTASEFKQAEVCALSGISDVRKKTEVKDCKDEVKELAVLVKLLLPEECEKILKKPTPSIDEDRPVVKMEISLDEDETQDVCRESCATVENDEPIEKSPDLSETCACEEEVVRPNRASNEMPTVSEVQQLLQDMQRHLRDLTNANRQLRGDINNPLHEAEEGPSDDSDTKTPHQRNNVEKKGWLTAQRSAVTVEWSSGDESIDHSFSMSGRNKSPKKKATRIFWTEQEMDWIREGVRKFGVGNWADMRDFYPFQTGHRNSVAIKDKYRNMRKNAQIWDTDEA